MRASGDSGSTSGAEALGRLLADRRRETEAALGAVGRITSSRDVGEVLRESIALAAAVARADSALLYLRDDDQRFWVRAALPADERWVDGFSLASGPGPGARLDPGPAPVLRRGRAHDPRDTPHPEPGRPFTATIVHPLVAPGGRLAGVIALFSEAPEGFDEEDLAAVGPIAGVAVAAIEKAQLSTSNRRQIDVLRSIGGLGDSLASPAATRRALHALGTATRRLLGGSVVAIYVREPHAWRLAMSASAHARGPAETIAFDVLDTLGTAAEPRRVSLQADRTLVAAVAPGATGIAGGILAPLRAGGEAVGALLCLSGHARVPETDRELIGLIATVAAMVVQSGRLVERLAADSAELAFLDALAGSGEPSGVVTARARQLGISLGEAHVVAAFEVADPGTGQADPEDALERLGTELVGRLPASVAARRGLELLALLRVPDDAVVAPHVEGALTLIESHDRIRLMGGLSGVVRDGEYSRAFVEAHDALSIGRAVRGAGHLVEYDALGALRHLWTLARSPVRDPFQARIEALQALDAQHGTEYVETIAAYLDEQGSRERASARLDIHRNTLRLRAERIRELSGIDLEDRDSRFELQVALGIVRFRALQRGAGPGHA